MGWSPECRSTRIEPPIKITTAGDSVLRGTAQGILLVVDSQIAHSVGARTEKKYIFEFGRSEEIR